MIPTFFVVADQSQAHLYKVGGTKLHPTLEEVEELAHPEARERLDPTDSNAPDSTLELFVFEAGVWEVVQRSFSAIEFWIDFS